MCPWNFREHVTSFATRRNLERTPGRSFNDCFVCVFLLMYVFIYLFCVCLCVCVWGGGGRGDPSEGCHNVSAT